MNILYLIIGGSAGTIARFLLGGFVHEKAGPAFPYGTMVVNLLGCFIIGLLSSLADKKFMVPPEMRVLLMIGFCGAFTTFSTFIFETDALLRDGEIMRATVNVFGSVIVGLLFFRIGSFLVEIM